MYTLILTCYVSEPIQCCHLIKKHFQRRWCAEMTAAVAADKEKEEQSNAASAESLCDTQLEAFLMGLCDMCIHFAVGCSKIMVFFFFFTEYLYIL